MRPRSAGSSRFALTLFLLRLNMRKKPAPEPSSLRVLSPPGGSTLITSAPRSPKIMPQVGPITMWENSTTRMPESGSCGDFFEVRTLRVARDLGAARRLVLLGIPDFLLPLRLLFCLGRTLGLRVQALRIKA